MNHEAIRHAYPNVVIIDDSAGALDAAGNPVELDQSVVDAAAVVIAEQQALAAIKRNRAAAFRDESDPLFFKAQRGEATMDEWQAKIDEIRQRYPKASPSPD